MTVALVIGILVIMAAAVLFGLALGNASAQAGRQARRARQDYLLRYKGGAPGCCVVCGERVKLNYALGTMIVHPGSCRDAVEAQLQSGGGTAA
jgi:hypothetical protein